MLESIVCNTNACAKWMIHKKCEQISNYIDKLWSVDGSNDINLTELKAYFGILIILGLNPIKQYQMAFSCDPFLGNEGIRKTMTLKHFEKISQYLHVLDWENEPKKTDANYDLLDKTQLIIKAWSKSFMQFMAGSTISAIDESMIRGNQDSHTLYIRFDCIVLHLHADYL